MTIDLDLIVKNANWRGPNSSYCIFLRIIDIIAPLGIKEYNIWRKWVKWVFEDFPSIVTYLNYPLT